MFKPFESWNHIDNISSLQDWMNKIGSQTWKIYKNVSKTFHQFLDPNFRIGSKNQPFWSFKMSCTLCSHSLYQKLSTLFTKEIRSRSHFKQWNHVSWLDNLNARWIWGKKSSLKGISYASSYHTQIGCQFNPKSYPAVLHGYKGFSLWEKPIKRQ
jgi:hypothetical protein